MPNHTEVNPHLSAELSTLRQRVTELETALAERRQSETLLRLQHEVSLAFSSAHNLPTALRLLLETITKIEGIDCGGVYLVDEATGALEVVAHRGLSAEFVAQVAHYEADTPSARLVMAGNPIYQNYSNLPMSQDPVRQRESLRAIGIIPIAYEGRVIAALNASSHTHDEIPALTCHTLETLALQLGGLLARMKAETLLQTSRENLQALFDTMEEFVFILDMQGRILKANPAVQQRLGYTDQELLGQSIQEVHPPERRAEAAAIVADMLAGRADTCPIPLITTTGTLIPVETKITRGTWNNQPALFGISRDITERLQAEAKLHESEEITRTLINASPDVVALLDTEGTILTLNEALARRFGQPLDEVVGRNIYEILPPEVAQSRKKFFDQAVQTGQPIQFEDENRGVFFESYVYPVLDSTGAVMRLAVYAHNITERRRMQEALQASEASFRLLFANNPHPMWVYDRQTLAFLEVNEAAIDHYGYSRAEFLRMTALDIRTPEEGVRLKEYMRRGHPDLRRAGHWQHRLKDGRFIEVEINSHVLNFAGREAVLVVAQDITERLEAEARLRESEERFRQLAENITEVFWITDPLSPVVYISPAYEAIWGRTCQSLYEQPSTFIEAVHPEDRAQFDRVMNQQYEGQRTELEYRVVRPDGSIRWVWDRGFPIFDEAGQVTRVAGVAVDLTERKEAEAKLRESELRFRQLAENIDQVFWMFDVSDLVYISPAYERIWGRTRQSLYENSFSFMESIHPDDQTRVNQAIEQQLQGQRTEIEYRVIRPDGSIRWILDRGFPIFNEQGQVHLIAGIAADMTARRQAELELQQRTREYETLVENVPDIVQRFDRSLRSIYVNSAFTKTFGIPAETLLNKTLREQGMTAEQTELMEQAVRHVFETGQPSMIMVKFDPPGSSTVYHQIRYAPEFGADGAVETVLAVGRDVTELKQAQAAVEGLNRTLETRVQERTAALQESEARYRLLAENASDMVALHDLDTTIRYVSPSVKEILGYEPEELIGTLPLALLHPEDTQRLEEDIYHYLTTGYGRKNVAYRLRRADGSYIWIETHSRPIIDDAGQVMQLQSSSRDITTRKEMEMQLRQSEEKYRVVADYTANWEYWRDQTGQFVYMSPSCQAITGYTVAEFQNNPNLLNQIVHPADQATMQAHLQEAEVVETAAQPGPLEFRIITKEGQVRWLEHQCRSIFTADGHWLGQRASNRDITERKLAEESLRASEQRFREIFELSPVGIFIGTVEGGIVRANAALCAMLGYTQEELQTKMLFELTYPADLAVEQMMFETKLLQGEAAFYEQRYLAKSGEVIWGNMASKIIADETGQFQYRLGIITNITERKDMEEALRLTADELSLANADLARAARLKDEFLASMSHELRTPLTAILGQSEVMQEQIYGPLTQEQQQALTDIQNSGQHLLTLINDLLDLSKIEAGKLELELRPVSVAAVCQASLRLIKNQAHKKELAVTFTQDETVQILQADERRLKQILVNLLSNAVKFTPAKGSVGLEVRADPQQGEVYFTVWDTGIGIAPEDMKRLFKPFVQLDSRLSRQYSGTGLGLSLVARLSQMHGGRVSLESEPGQGSRFTVALPWSGLSQRQLIQAEKSGPEAPTDKAPARLIETGVILVAEDNEQVLQLLLQYLQVGGYRTIVARNGQEALRQAAQARPQLVLMDVQMPGMDGLETIRRLRAAPDRELARLPVIALTALVAPEDREQCLKAGADAFLPKPVRLKELIGTIERVLSGSPA